jgi:hypothetical protein
MSWKYAKPPDAEKGKPIIWNDKEWWWCDNHKAYVHHKPDECEGKGVKPDTRPEKAKAPAKDKRQLKFSKALQAVNEGGEEDDESSIEE